MAKKRWNGPRTPSGQKSRAKNPSAIQAVREAPADELAIEVRAKRQAAQWGLGTEDRQGNSTLRDEKRGSYIGVLRMLWIQTAGAEGISEGHYHAGTIAREIRSNYLKAIAAPGAVYDASSGSGSGDTEAHEKFCAIAKERWALLADSILDLERETRLPHYMSALHKCVLTDEGGPFGIGIIREVLNRVHKVFIEAPKQRKAA